MSNDKAKKPGLGRVSAVCALKCGQRVYGTICDDGVHIVDGTTGLMFVNTFDWFSAAIQCRACCLLRGCQCPGCELELGVCWASI